MLPRKFIPMNLICACLLGLGTLSMFSQDVVPRYALEISKEIPVGNLFYRNLLLPHRCDTKGNIYLRFYTAPSALRARVMKFTSEGEQEAEFATDSVKDWERAEIHEYAIGSDGQVYLLVGQLTNEKKLKFGVLIFDEDGHHRFSIRLNPSFESVDNLAVLSGGGFLIVGFRKVEDPGPRIPGTPTTEQKKTKPPVEPMLLIVNRNGDVATEVSLDGGLASGKADGTAEKVRIPAGAVNMASVVAGDDGNIYLLFPGDKPTIYVLSGSGEVVRTLEVKPPTEKSVARTLALASGVGLLLTTAEKVEQENATLYPADRIFFSLINPQTGERLYDYQSNAKVGGGLACYTPQGMFFLGKSDQKLVIRKATFR